MSPILVLMIGIWLADTLRESKANEEKLKKDRKLTQDKDKTIKIGDPEVENKPLEPSKDKLEKDYPVYFEEDLEEKDQSETSKKSMEKKLRGLFSDLEKGLESFMEEENIEELEDIKEAIESDVEIQDSINRKKRELEEREAILRRKERELEASLKEKLEKEKSSFSLANDKEDIINGIIFSEILKKPKSLR